MANRRILKWFSVTMALVLIASLGAAIVSATPALAAYDTGWLSPQSNSGNFTDPQNAYADGGAYASATNGKVHQYFGYDFSSIPLGSKIDGIEVRMDAWRTSGDFSGSIAVELSWDDGTSWTTTGNSVYLQGGEVNNFRGDYSDWGHAWTRDEIVNHFRVRLTATTDATVYLDWVSIDVSCNQTGYYLPTVAAAGNAQWPERALTKDSAHAGFSAYEGYRLWENYSTFNFGSAIPSNATIDGITVHLVGYGYFSGGPRLDVSLSWDNGTNWSSIRTTGIFQEGPPDQDYFVDWLGGPSDTWGKPTAWVDTDFSNANFLVKITRSGGGEESVFIDYLEVKVYSTPVVAVSVDPAAGTYGGTVDLTATLTSGGVRVSGKSISFTLNGVSKGSATTNGSGIATLTGVSLSGINAGTYADYVGASFAGDASYGSSSGTASLTVNKAALTITALTNTKTYDGNTSAAATPTVSGLKGADTVTGLTETYNNKSAGTGKTLSVATYTVNDGNSGNNYTVTTVTNTTGVITAKGLTVSGITANNKVYDGATTATLNIGSASLVGVVSGDVVTLNTGSATGTFDTPSVGVGKTVTVSGLTIGGAAAINYTLTQPTTTADITGQPEVWIDAATGDDGNPGTEEAPVATIQKGIDISATGGTVNVAEGTYTENVNVNKKVSLLGAGDTLAIVQAASAGDHVFDISADEVVINGFTMKGATNTDKAGVYLGPGTDNCVVSNNTLQFNHTGIYVQNSSSNTLKSNTPTLNIYGFQLANASSNMLTSNAINENTQYGIFMREVCNDNQIVGNNIRANGSVDSGIHRIGSGSGNVIHLNNIVGNQTYGINNQGTGTLNAENNWWGYASGPYHPINNTGGEGNEVSDNVDYEPWIRAQVTECVSQSGAGGEVDATGEADTVVDITGGTADVYIAQYGSNPGSGFSGDTGKYVDVMIQNLTGVTEIETRLYYTDAEIAGLTESSLRLRWWDGDSWEVCSDSGINTTDIPAPPPADAPYSGYMWAKIRNDTTPTLAQLTGTPFGGAGTGAGGGGGGGIVPPTTISKVGAVSLLPYIDWQGKTRAKIILKSDDGVLTITTFSETLVHNAAGNPLENMGIVTLSTPPPPPGYVLVGHAYDCLPDGANFAPKVTMTFTYDEADIPDGGSERGLVLAYWDGNKWVNLSTTINAAANTATAEVEHFTPFALLAYTGLAKFSASELSIQPLKVQPNDVVTITLSVANTGDTEGSYKIALKINGVKEAEKNITLAAGESQSISFSVTREEAGSDSVDVNGLTGSFTVAAPVAPTEETPSAALTPIAWWIWVIAGVVIMGLLVILFVVMRRRA